MKTTDCQLQNTPVALDNDGFERRQLETLKLLQAEGMSFATAEKILKSFEGMTKALQRVGDSMTEAGKTILMIDSLSPETFQRHRLAPVRGPGCLPIPLPPEDDRFSGPTRNGRLYPRDVWLRAPWQRHDSFVPPWLLDPAGVSVSSRSRKPPPPQPEIKALQRSLLLAALTPWPPRGASATWSTSGYSPFTPRYEPIWPNPLWKNPPPPRRTPS